MMPGKRATPGPVDQKVAIAISHFGAEVGPKLRKRVGSPEEQLREPFSRLIREVGRILGVRVDTYGEASLPTLGIRPDYVVDVAGARVGYVELKRPGRGVPTTWSPDKRERVQWEQLSLLPNVLYTDGEQWAVYRYGEIVGRVARLSVPLERAGANLAPADGQLARVLTEFLLWKPDPPRTVSQLVRAVARLCRLLRSEVSETLGRERRGQEPQTVFTGLASDWRRLLFPGLPDEGFADAYAQTVTFALLLARLDGVDFDAKDLPEIARLLGKKHSLMGKALAVLTEDSVEGRSIVVPTLLRVIGAVDRELTGGASSDSYLSLYESFLAEYDEELRERSGSYYTPNEVVTFMVGFVEELLRTQLDKEWGLATEDVFILDPAMGTGTFLLSVIDKVACTIAEEQGPGAVPAELRDLFKRLIGFEKQAGPYAVAELCINQAIKAEHGTEIPESEARLYLADTLDSPYEEDFGSLSGMDAITRSRREANKVKLSTPVMVVIGNPPYDAKAKGQGGWIETGNPNHGQPPLDAFRAAGNGRYEYVLSDFYVFFWRWATWKVFDAHPEHPAGIVAFISPRSYTTGPGYAGMREYLRKTADEGWVIDVSPEDSLQPDVPPESSPGFRTRCASASISGAGRLTKAPRPGCATEPLAASATRSSDNSEASAQKTMVGKRQPTAGRRHLHPHPAKPGQTTQLSVTSCPGMLRVLSRTAPGSTRPTPTPLSDAGTNWYQRTRKSEPSSSGRANPGRSTAACPRFRDFRSPPRPSDPRLARVPTPSALPTGPSTASGLSPTTGFCTEPALAFGRFVRHPDRSSPSSSTHSP